MIQVKYVVAPDIHHLETRVNAFLAQYGAGDWDFHGSPQVFAHETYVQAFILHTKETF